MLTNIKCLNQEHGDRYSLYHGDSCEIIQAIPDNSIGMSVYSPPFSSLYTYTPSVRDIGNCKNDEEFYNHFGFLASEMYRIIMSGRIMAVHCMQIPALKERDGYIGLKDFRGDLIRLFQRAGFIYHSEVLIKKDPVVQMQRTKALGLLHKQLVKDSAMSRQALPDYLVMFRKPGDNLEPIAGKLTHYHGTNPPPKYHDLTKQSINIWQRYADEVWFDIDQSDTLNYQEARDAEDGRHICLAKDSLVLTYHKGYIPIQDIEVGKDLVLTHKGRWMPVIAKRKTSDRADVVSINATGVNSLTLTPDHKLWTRTCNTANKGHLKENAMKSTPTWVEAKDLEKQYINFQLPPTEESDLTEKEWWIVGRWLADGHLAIGTSKRTSLHISVGTHKLEEFMNHAEEFAGTRHQFQDSCVQIRIKDPDKRLRKAIANCGCKAHEKRIPPEAYRLPKAKAKALLDGFLSGDGHFNKDRQRWSASSTSKNLLLGIQSLILRVYGVTSTLHPGKGERQATIQGRIVNCRQIWVLSFQSHGYQFSFVLDDGAWKKVKSVTDAGQSETWNIQVLEDASYTAEGCIVKNCPLQLTVIRRAVQLWSNPNDIVFTPFLGIGSEAYVAVEEGRRAVGIELKDSYFEVACKNLRAIANKPKQYNLFEV